MKDAPADDGMSRLYTFFVPFLQPEIDGRFRENGVRLLGNAAFLYQGEVCGYDVADIAVSWFTGMNVLNDTRTECKFIAAAMKKSGCRAYLTGMFGFDRWMGAMVPLQRRILKEEYGFPTYVLDTDFWCENAMFGSVLSRVDNICALLEQAER
jgi:hypothetical protein